MKPFIIFHLNICFSSIDENERKKVIQKCYWPLINLIEKLKVKIGLEATGYSLEEIQKIDKKFILKLKSLIKTGYCEFIGSGYSQSIGPLIPSRVNNFNLKIGNDLYKKILDIRPQTALINEQAFSLGILDNYLQNGYKNIIMDWDNCFKSNKNIKEGYFYFPQKILTVNKKKINVIWSSTIMFQKFQRFIYGEISVDEYFKFIKSKCKSKDYNLCIYASDLEVINYRAKRYKTETNLKTNEWHKVEALIKKFFENRYEFIHPSKVLLSKKNKFCNNILKFEDPSFPCITKKQSKYNILRWAVTGRDDNKINSKCWQIFNHLQNKKKVSYQNWKELCYLWSSDFRTHITKKRWKAYIKRLDNFKNKIVNGKNKKNIFSVLKSKRKDILINNLKDKVSIKGKNIEILLNKKKGCSIEKFYDYRQSKKFLFGFIPHGYFKDIKYSADFFSGHLVIEPLGFHKITDLVKTNVKIKKIHNYVVVECDLKNKLGKILKKIIFDNNKSRIGIYYKINLKRNILGSIRLNHINLNPEIYRKSLFYETNNGGHKPEKFNINFNNFDHGQGVSHLISANQALGLTNNFINFGDNIKPITVNIDRNLENLVGMVSFKKIFNKNFYRLYFSVKEHDDTTKDNNKFNSETLIWIKSK